MIVWRDISDIYQIKETDEHLIPNIKALKKNLGDFKDKKMSKTEFIIYLNEFVESGEEDAAQELQDYKDHVLQKLSGQSDPMPYNVIQKCLSSNDQGYKKPYMQFSKFLQLQYGIVSNPQIRSKDGEEKFDYGLINFNKIMTWPTPPEFNNNKKDSYTYMVGAKGSLTRSGMEKGLPFKCIVRKNEKEIDRQFVLDLLSMTMVDFVRLGQWTVTPYFMRILNEYEDIVLPKIKNSNREINLNMLKQSKMILQF